MTRPTLDLRLHGFALVDTPDDFQAFDTLAQLVEAILAWRAGRRLRIEQSLVVIGDEHAPDGGQVRPACTLQAIEPDGDGTGGDGVDGRVVLARGPDGLSLRADALAAAVAAATRARRTGRRAA